MLITPLRLVAGLISLVLVTISFVMFVESMFRSMDRRQGSISHQEIKKDLMPKIQLNETFTRCTLDGFNMGGAAAYNRFHFPNLPKLREVFVDVDRVIGIVNLHEVPDTFGFWNQNNNWRCEFRLINGKTHHVASSTPGCDFHGHTQVVTCDLPKDHTGTVSIFGQINVNGAERYVGFRSVTLCFLPPAPKIPEFFAVCTQAQLRFVKDRQLEYLAAWYKELGASKIIVYANEDPSLMQERVAKSPLKNMFKIIDHNHPIILRPGDAFDQQSTQMSCVYRTRRRYQWVFLGDIDEFAYFSKYRDLMSVLSDLPKDLITNYGGIYLCNLWHQMGNLTSKDYDPRLHRTSSNLCKKRGKFIVHPENINYFSVHEIVDGKPEYVVPDAYLAHLSWKPDKDEYPVSNSHFADRMALVIEKHLRD